MARGGLCSCFALVLNLTLPNLPIIMKISHINDQVCYIETSNGNVFYFDESIDNELFIDHWIEGQDEHQRDDSMTIEELLSKADLKDLKPLPIES